MRVGFAVECHRDGADHKGIEHLVSVLNPRIEPFFLWSGSKRVLLRDCGTHVEELFDNYECERAFVVWDLIPSDAEHQHEGKSCRRKEREHFLEKLRPQDRQRTVLLCIPQELEAWLLADSEALKTVLGSKSHPVRRIRNVLRPEEEANPKTTLTRLFNEHSPWPYNDVVHAVKIIKNVKDLSKLEKVPSFARFKQKLEAL